MFNWIRRICIENYWEMRVLYTRKFGDCKDLKVMSSVDGNRLISITAETCYSSDLGYTYKYNGKSFNRYLTKKVTRVKDHFIRFEVEPYPYNSNVESSR